MPLYEYACPSCGHSFEELVFGEDEKVVCPRCQTVEVERQVSLPGRPKVAATSLPTACRSAGPPCGPACSRWPG
jgi:putative FmdB family regulatory protein